VVAAGNGEAAVELWAAAAGARPLPSRRLQRGARHPMTVRDFVVGGRTVATLCLVEGLGHAWSGGAASQRFSDPRGPDASRMIWSFAARQFRTTG
jgi:poly(3-hydroxybutyrate) depolymerase